MSIPARWRINPGLDKTVAVGAASVQSAAVGVSTYAVLLSSTTNCHISMGPNPTATTSNFLLKATDPGSTIGISPGEKIAVIQDTAGGTLYIAELTS